MSSGPYDAFVSGLFNEFAKGLLFFMNLNTGASFAVLSISANYLFNPMYTDEENSKPSV